MYLLIIKWNAGDIEIYFYPTEPKAKAIEEKYKKLFSNLITYMYIRKGR